MTNDTAACSNCGDDGTATRVALQVSADGAPLCELCAAADPWHRKFLAVVGTMVASGRSFEEAQPELEALLREASDPASRAFLETLLGPNAFEAQAGREMTALLERDEVRRLWETFDELAGTGPADFPARMPVEYLRALTRLADGRARAAALSLTVDPLSMSSIVSAEAALAGLRQRLRLSLELRPARPGTRLARNTYLAWLRGRRRRSWAKCAAEIRGAIAAWAGWLDGGAPDGAAAYRARLRPELGPVFDEWLDLGRTEESFANGAADVRRIVQELRPTGPPPRA